VNRKLEAARKIMSILPKDSRTVILERISEGDKNVNAIREYMGFECLLQAHFTYNIWKFHHYKKPDAPTPPTGSSVPEQIDYENKLKVYKEKVYAVWNEKDVVNSETARKEILKVLQYENGWMLDFGSGIYFEPGSDERRNQMLLIRRKCIPELCFMLHTILYSTHNYQSSLDLAVLIADEHYMLYTTFKQEEIQKLMGLFHQSALILLKPG
jgi:nuclear pore complex protein Nup107